VNFLSAADQEIHSPVIVEVGADSAHAPHRTREPSQVRDIGKGPIAIVSPEGAVAQRTVLNQFLSVGPVLCQDRLSDIHIEVAIVVVVNEANPNGSRRI
jgi:hypothetical protein